MRRFLFALFVLSIHVCVVEAAPQKLTFVYEVKPNPPFYLGQGLSIDWEKPGITLEVLKLLENKLNVTLHFKRMPWARGLESVRSNQVDGIFHASFKKDRLLIGCYPMKAGQPDVSREIMNQSYFFYKRKDSPLQWDGDNLTHLNGAVGAVLEYAIVGDLQKMGIPIEETTSQLKNLRKLSAGRIAAFAGIETMTDTQIRLHPEEFKDIIKVYPALKQKPYYLMLSHKFVKDQPKLSEAIWNTIKEIRQTGQYNRIAQKYMQMKGSEFKLYEK